MNFLIENARVLDPSQKLDRIADVWIEQASIKAIENPGVLSKKFANQTDVTTGVTRVDAKNKWLLPGFVDAHVHLREPGHAHKETISTGTHAAVVGGFTSVACMANTSPTNDSALVTQWIYDRAKEKARSRVFVIGAVSKGLKGEELAPLVEMAQAGAVAFSDDGMPVMNSMLMRRAMEISRSLGIAVISHAEDANLVAGGVVNEGKVSLELGLRGNPNAAEEILVAREIALCRLTRCRTHIAHVSTKEAVELIRRAKQDGLPITAEVAPHHLVFDENHIDHYNTHCKMAPPLRTAEDTQALLSGLADGVIDMIATDHAPHAEHEKDTDFESAAFGVTGLETAVLSTFQYVKSGKLSLERWVQSLTSSPAALINQKNLGKIAVGGVADLTLMDPQATGIFDGASLVGKSKNSLQIGQPFSGLVCGTWVAGKLEFQR